MTGVYVELSTKRPDQSSEMPSKSQQSGAGQTAGPRKSRNFGLLG